MNVADTLEALRNKAMHDPSLKKALLETRNHPNSLGEFCSRCGAARMAEGRIRRCWMAKMMHMRFFCMSWSRAEMPERNFGGRFFFTCVECTGMI